MDLLIGKGVLFRENYRYAVYERRLEHLTGLAYLRFFIVLKNQYGVIVHFTDFHRYVGIYENHVFRPLASDARERLMYVCQMLNCIIIEKYKEYGVSHVFRIDRGMLEAFFRDYAMEALPNGKFRSKESIEKCVAAVTGFFRRLCRKYEGYMAIRIDELYTEKFVYSKHRRTVKKMVPAFEVCGISEVSPVFRDIPAAAFELLAHQAFQYAPEIAFAICTQAFAGLRPGEAMNIRREDSPYGAGVRLTFVDGQLRSAEIDIRREYVLRGDGVSCGKIKKERVQKVYPAFLPAFRFAYEHHKAYLSTREYETEYCPMFVGRRGKAMTYEDYRTKFSRLVTEHFRPALLKHENSEMRLYGQLLYEHTLGPHALRHWFSVQLVLMGEDVAQLQYWRGDTSPESAITYLQNKGDLNRKLAAVNNVLGSFMLDGGGKE